MKCEAIAIGEVYNRNWNEKGEGQRDRKETSRRSLHVHTHSQSVFMYVCMKRRMGFGWRRTTTSAGFVWLFFTLRLYVFGVHECVRLSACLCVVRSIQNAVDKYYRILPKPYSSKSTLLHEPNAQYGFSRVAAAPQLHIVRISQAHQNQFNFTLISFEEEKKPFSLQLGSKAKIEIKIFKNHPANNEQNHYTRKIQMSVGNNFTHQINRSWIS